MKKVLIIGTTNIYGGVGHIIFEYCKHIEKRNVQFDFLYYEIPSSEELSLIHSYNGTFYKISRYSKYPFRFYKEIKRFFSEHHYNIVHIHASTAMLMIYALPVWRDAATKIIFQSHAEFIKGKLNAMLHRIFKGFVKKYTDIKIAISSSAAVFMFGRDEKEKVTILKNGVDLKKYEFSEFYRQTIRRTFDIKDEFVLGHVGRFVYEKNHSFIINVFEKFHQLDTTAKLLLVGGSGNENEIRQIVHDKGLCDFVIFAGTSNEVEKLLCAMDCFIFPSLHEGLGIVAIEAQANGLPVVVSDHLPHELAATKLYIPLSLTKDPIEQWASTIFDIKSKLPSRQQPKNDLITAGYDIKNTVLGLRQIYLCIW